MRRFLLLSCVLLLVFGSSAIAQETGRLQISVQRAGTTSSLGGSVMGAKVIVVHWTNPGQSTSLVHDQVATTNQMGTCTVDLPPGTYDVFVSSSDLAPAAFRRKIKVGQTTSLTATLRSAPLHLRPVQ